MAVSTTDPSSESSVTWGVSGKPFTNGWAPRGQGPRFAGIHDPNTVSITSQAITIAPFFDGDHVHTGAVSTYGHFMVVAGELDAKLKICLKAPLRTAIWLQSGDNRGADKEGKIGSGSEIDVAEVYNQSIAGQNAKVANNIHWGGYGQDHATVGHASNMEDPCVDHIYKAIFSGAGQQFFVDGVLKWATPIPARLKNEYIIFSIEQPMPLENESLPNGTKLGSATLEYIRIEPERKKLP